MALNQTHHDIRYALATTIDTIQKEKVALATSVARNTAIGVPSVGDGGAGSTGELLDAVNSLDEVIDAAVGETDFAGIAPLIADITATNSAADPINLSPDAESLVIRVANLLPFPLIRLLPQPSGTAIVITPYIASIAWTKTNFEGSALKLPIGTITISDVGVAVATNDYIVEVSNPLDSTAAVAESNVVWLTATP